MDKETKQETLDICVIARFRDKEIAMKDLLKALFDENEKLIKENRQTKLLKERYQSEKEVYKSRNEKAIEYCGNTTRLDAGKVINILKGSEE